eukprot:TRINITY_DN11845_c0_g1_i1.p1 TRINITY_DN11845_c0_g1~~TRINITY_DN11845_c0_g1_i1.p1  ORF type:complete len:285 (-),score=31.49 TRINITY_DN11845_c0_g1_i1:20-874(-)
MDDLSDKNKKLRQTMLEEWQEKERVIEVLVMAISNPSAHVAVTKITQLLVSYDTESIDIVMKLLKRARSDYNKKSLDVQLQFYTFASHISSTIASKYSVVKPIVDNFVDTVLLLVIESSNTLPCFVLTSSLLLNLWNTSVSPDNGIRSALEKSDLLVDLITSILDNKSDTIFPDPVFDLVSVVYPTLKKKISSGAVHIMTSKAEELLTLLRSRTDLANEQLYAPLYNMLRCLSILFQEQEFKSHFLKKHPSLNHLLEVVKMGEQNGLARSKSFPELLQIVKILE